MGQGRDPRSDSDALTRLERSLSRLDQIINGTDFGYEGILTVNKHIRAELVALGTEVHEMKRDFRWMKWAVWILIPVVTALGMAVLLAFNGLWSNIG